MGLRELILDLRGLILGLRGLSFGPERTDFGPERTDLGPERADLGPERGLGGGRTDIHTYRWTDVRTDGRTDGRTDVWKFTPVSYRTSALWGRCPKRILFVKWKIVSSSFHGVNAKKLLIFSRVHATL